MMIDRYTSHRIVYWYVNIAILMDRKMEKEIGNRHEDGSRKGN